MRSGPIRGSVRRGAGGAGWVAGWHVMGSGSSKAAAAASSSSSPAASEAGGEVKRGNGSGKGRRARSLLPLPSSACFRGSAAPGEGGASSAAPLPAGEVRALAGPGIFLRFVCVAGGKLRVRAAGTGVVNRGEGRAFP